MSDIVLQDQSEPTGLSSNETAIYPDTTTGKLRSKKGTNPSKAIEGVEDHSALNLDDGTNPHGTTKSDIGLSNVSNVDATQRSNHTGSQLSSTISNFATTVKNVVLSGLNIVNAVVTSSDTVQEAIGKLQGQLNNVNASKVERIEYKKGTTVDPSTTAQTSGTASVLAEMTDTFTPSDADNIIEAFFSGTFGEDGTGKDETVFVAIFIDGNIQTESIRSQTTKGDADTDKISSITTQWAGSLSESSHTIDVRFWIRGAGGATAVSIDTRRSLLIRETDL